MIKFIIFFWILTFVSALQSTQPLILCLLLISYSLSISMLFYSTFSSWLAYAVLLIFLGGMMIVFLYVSTLASSQKLFIYMSPYTLSLMLFISIFLLPLISSFGLQNQFNFVSQFYSNSTVVMIVFLILYLLFTLFLVVKISESFKGALAKKW